LIFAGSLENLFAKSITLFAQVKDGVVSGQGSAVGLPGSRNRFGQRHIHLLTYALSSRWRSGSRRRVHKEGPTATVMTIGLLGDKYVAIIHTRRKTG
jgi:hypothetical protein